MRERLILVGLMCLTIVASSSTGADAQSTRQDEEARTLFSLGSTAYDEGRFADALDYFQRAYDLSQRPQLLFNVGQAADRLRQDRRALEAFEAFLAAVPNAPQREAIVARVAILRASIERAEAAPAAPPAVEPPAPVVAPEPVPVPVDDGRSAVPGVVIASGGGAVLVVGVVFLALGMGDANDVEGAPDGTPFADVADAYDRAPTRITVGSILAGVGLAATATGIVLAARSGRRDDDRAALELRATPGGLLLRGSF